MFTAVDTFFVDSAIDAIPISHVEQNNLESWISSQNTFSQNILKNLVPEKSSDLSSPLVLKLPDESGALNRIVFISSSSHPDLKELSQLATQIGSGVFILEDNFPSAYELCLSWALSLYNFTHFKSEKSEKSLPKLVWPKDVDQHEVMSKVRSIFLARDMINTPANIMTPEKMEEFASKIATTFNAQIKTTKGSTLESEYPLVHAVGKAGEIPPRLIDITWGNEAHPKLTLVGKGVCFDSGGLDIKDAGNMLYMKKDMGGAAIALSLGQLIMSQQWPVRLRILLPSVENAISSNAFRPLDVIKSRKGTTVEIGNTDAEGRLILADALFEATQESPKMIVDFSTLTGAARIAVGTEISAFFTNQEPEVFAELIQDGTSQNDPMWPLPLYQGYKKMFQGKTADLNNIANTPQGGAIVAALFLEHFVGKSPWIHVDTNAWNVASRPGKPEGGEAMSLLSMYHFLSKRFKN